MYKVVINTSAYKLSACSQKNWEAGTRNDFMVALNGWHSTEKNLLEVRWRLEMFRGNTWLSSEWDESLGSLSLRYQNWSKKRCNTLKYHDRLCGFDRQQEISPYGWKQGYFDIDEVLKELKEKGVVRVPFEAVYDIRQFPKNMKGCYMEITKC